MHAAHVDSVKKICLVYFPSVTKEDYQFEGIKIHAKPLKVSPNLLRGVVCPPGCGACCRRFTLDWLPSEMEKLKVHGYPIERLVTRQIEVNGRKVPVLSDMQKDHQDYFCRNLRKEDGRCMIHAFSPFSCDFELIRFLRSDEESRPNILIQKLFGRGWNMTRSTDGEKGSRCYMTPPSSETVSSVIRRLERFQDWTDHFGLQTWVPDIIGLIKSGRLVEPVTFHPYPPQGFGL